VSAYRNRAGRRVESWTVRGRGGEPDVAHWQCDGCLGGDSSGDSAAMDGAAKRHAATCNKAT